MYSNQTLEIWGGVECTVNRVEDQYFDQLQLSGHQTRLSDLDLFAQTGIKSIRYPVLWERTAPDGLDSADWSWADERLNRIRELGMNPIVGFVHHGSGPRHTSLVDPQFPERLAAYAGAIARRYPWLRDFTPINEPLTTARFSCLYGHWYPHHRSDTSFITALLNQMKGIVLSMRAIRKVIPNARLVQTEDLGKIYASRKIQYQAKFENERRWLSFDLLMGRVTTEHKLWKFLIRRGATEEQLNWFVENRCPPDIMGINHYITSNRYLDEDVAEYPRHARGGNKRHRYADVEAVRVGCHKYNGHSILLKEAWDRYGQPLAVTEVHLDAPREDQLRWLKEVRDSLLQLRTEGVDVRAMTAWSLLGAYDWDSLLTRQRGYYESGVFDLRGGAPRPTILSHMLKSFSNGEEFEHPVLDAMGWWHRPCRVLYRASEYDLAAEHKVSSSSKSCPILITGSTGTLGRAFARMCDFRGIKYHVLTRQDMDITDPSSVRRVLNDYKPWALINCAGYVRVDEAESDVGRCIKENTEGPAILAAECAQSKIAFVTFSSDLVFDGNRGEPYTEKTGVSPINVYGRSKAEAEARVTRIYPESLVIRTSAFFGPWDEHNFITQCLQRLSRGENVEVSEDCTVSPTYIPDLVMWTLNLLLDGERGIWHLSNKGEITWAGLATLVAERANLDCARIIRKSWKDLGHRAPRPKYSVLGSYRGHYLPPLEAALNRYFSDREIKISGLK